MTVKCQKELVKKERKFGQIKIMVQENNVVKKYLIRKNFVRKKSGIHNKSFTRTLQNPTP